MDIKIISWNCLEATSSKFGVILKIYMLQIQKSDILILLETILSGHKADEVI